MSDRYGAVGTVPLVQAFLYMYMVNLALADFVDTFSARTVSQLLPKHSPAWTP
jgi:hypothetical protein